MIVDVCSLILVVVLTKISQTHTDKIGSKHQCTTELYDIMHANFKDLSQYEHLIDIFPLSVISGTIWLLVTNHPSLDTPKLIRQCFVTFMLRCITTMVTVLPSPICGKKASPQAIGGCNDCIFSGHTALTLLFAYAIYICQPTLMIPLLLYCIFASLWIILSRSHYTIDVLVAWIVVYAVILSV